jgi:hypothetical protein
MSRVEEIINMVDKPGEPKKFRFRPLKYIMAAALKSKIEALAEQLGTVSITIASQPGQPAPQSARGGRPVPRPPTQPLLQLRLKLSIWMSMKEQIGCL